MCRSTATIPHNNYWVAVFCQASTDACLVRYSIDIKSLLENIDKAYKPVYVKCYKDMYDALGHKLFLDTVSAETLMRIIKRQNPEKIDLREKLMQIM